MEDDKLIFDTTLRVTFDLGELPLWEAERREEMETVRYFLLGRKSGMEKELARDAVESC